MEALGFKPKPPPHDEARSDTNHPTRPGTFRSLESGGFQGCGFKGFWVRVVRGLFAASLGARGAGVCGITRGGFPRRFWVTRGWLPRCSVRTRGGLTSKRRPSRLSGLVRSFRRQCESRSAAFCVGVEGRRLGGVTLECLAPPLSPLHLVPSPQRILQLSA